MPQNVGIGTNAPKDYAKLDIESSTSGLHLPRVTNAQRSTLGGNISGLGAATSITYNGLIVYDTDDNVLYMWDSNKSDFTNGGWASILDEDASLDDADADPNNEIQTISKSGSTVTLSDGGGSFTDAVDDADASTTNEIQDLSLSGNTLSLSSDATTVDLSGYVNTDAQNLSSSSSGTNRTINISGGTGTTISVADNDNSTSNEIQDLSLSGNTLSLSSDATTVDLSGYVNTDNQDLSISGNTLSLTNDASTVDLSGYLDNTDAQNLSSTSSGTNRTIKYKWRNRHHHFSSR